MTKFVESLGESFRVKFVTHSVDKANEFLEKNPNTGVFSERNGEITIADNKPVRKICNDKRNKK